MNRTPAGALFSNCVRSVLGVLPGSSLTIPFADFVLKGIGVAETATTPKPGKMSAVTKFFGCSGNFEIFPVNLGSGSMLGCTRLEGDSGTRVWTPRYPFVRISGLTAEYSPTNELAHYAGRVVMGWIPYTTPTAKAFYRDATQIPSFRDVIDIPGAACADAKTQFSIQCRLSGFCAQPLPPDEALGQLVISYENNSRTSGEMLTPSECAPSIQLRAKMSSRAGYEHEIVVGTVETAYDHYHFRDNVSDLLKPYACRIFIANIKSRGAVMFENDKQFKCEYDTNTKSCTLTGNASTYITRNRLPIEAMAIE